MDRSMDQSMDRWIDRWMDRWINECINYLDEFWNHICCIANFEAIPEMTSKFKSEETLWKRDSLNYGIWVSFKECPSDSQCFNTRWMPILILLDPLQIIFHESLMMLFGAGCCCKLRGMTRNSLGLYGFKKVQGVSRPTSLRVILYCM